MSLVVPQVFISSTSEFSEEREAIAAKIRALRPPCFPFIYENEPARSASPETYCAQMIDASEVLVLVLGGEYGSTFPGQTRSIVEWEYDKATANPAIAIHAYVKDLPPGTVVPPAQTAFIDRITGFRSGHWSKFFAPGRLAEMVVTGIQSWRAEAHQRFVALQRREAPGQERILILTTAGVAVLTTAGVVACALLGKPIESTITVALGGIAVIAILGLLLKTRFKTEEQ